MTTCLVHQTRIFFVYTWVSHWTLNYSTLYVCSVQDALYILVKSIFLFTFFKNIGNWGNWNNFLDLPQSFKTIFLMSQFERIQFKFIGNKLLNLFLKILHSQFIKKYPPNFTSFSDTRIQYRILKGVYASFMLLKKILLHRNLTHPSLPFTYVWIGPVAQMLRADYSHQIIITCVKCLTKLYFYHKSSCSSKIIKLDTFLINRIVWTLQGIVQEMNSIWIWPIIQPHRWKSLWTNFKNISFSNCTKLI